MAKPVLEPLVYDIAQAFGKIGQVLTARRLYDKLPSQSRPYFPALRDEILPKLVERGLLKISRVSESYTMYELLGVANMPEMQKDPDIHMEGIDV